MIYLLSMVFYFLAVPPPLPVAFFLIDSDFRSFWNNLFCGRGALGEGQGSGGNMSGTQVWSFLGMRVGSGSRRRGSEYGSLV